MITEEESRKERARLYNEKLAAKIAKEFEDHKDQFCLYDFEVVKFVGIELDEDDDYFYKFISWGGKHTTVSCCFKLVKLKNFLPESDYIHLEYLWSLNQELWDPAPSAAREIVQMNINYQKRICKHETYTKEETNITLGDDLVFTYKLCKVCGETFDEKMK